MTLVETCFWSLLHQTDEKIYVIALNSFRTIATAVDTSAQLFL